MIFVCLVGKLNSGKSTLAKMISSGISTPDTGKYYIHLGAPIKQIVADISGEMTTCMKDMAAKFDNYSSIDMYDFSKEKRNQLWNHGNITIGQALQTVGEMIHKFRGHDFLPNMAVHRVYNCVANSETKGLRDVIIIDGIRFPKEEIEAIKRKIVNHKIISVMINRSDDMHDSRDKSHYTESSVDSYECDYTIGSDGNNDLNEKEVMDLIKIIEASSF